MLAERIAATSFCVAAAVLSRRARHRALSATGSRSQLGSPDDLLVIADFDLTLTCGGSTQCHDVLGKSPRMPPAVLESFAPLLDFSKPMPPQWDGNGWWEHANDILVSHGAPRRELLPQLVAEAQMPPRPGARALLGLLAAHDVPVLVVSAGFADVIEEWLRHHGMASANVRVSSNRLRWDGSSGALADVQPRPPITSLNKAQTAARNADFFAAHAARRRLLVLGDRCSDLDAASGVACDARFAVGILNDETEYKAAPPEEYARRFDLLLRGSAASLQPVADLVAEAAAAAGVV